MLKNHSQVWRDLKDYAPILLSKRISDLFAVDPERFSKYSLEAAGLFLDYSKSFVDDHCRDLLFGLAKEVDLQQHIAAMFAGDKINITERRAVLHTALRNIAKDAEVFVDGKDVMPEIRQVWRQMEDLVTKVRAGKWLGFSGKAIKSVVNIGIGGSDLGPRMVVAALKPYTLETLNYHFVANVDGSELAEVLKIVDPETTLFIVASKSFTTQETLTNAASARKWFLAKTGASKDALCHHFVAVSAKPELAVEFGIAPENVLPFWDWVGGRFSLWSAIGLIVAIAIGMERFLELLAGANEMDQHFATAPYAQNMPVILALLAIWYRNFCGAESYAILPYDQYMHLLPSYLQQLEMESNGKSVSVDGESVEYKTAPIIWGQAGTNGQHAFHQLLLQGTSLVPVDFILPKQSLNPLGEQHELLIANCLAQSKALMEGRGVNEIKQELEEKLVSSEEITRLIPHKLIKGNVPSTTILLDKVTPKTLGSLIALYEHKVFVMGVILGINSFDQWGVELGKKLANTILNAQSSSDMQTLDPSTQGLLQRLR